MEGGRQHYRHRQGSGSLLSRAQQGIACSRMPNCTSGCRTLKFITLYLRQTDKYQSICCKSAHKSIGQPAELVMPKNKTNTLAEDNGPPTCVLDPAHRCSAIRERTCKEGGLVAVPSFFKTKSWFEGARWTTRTLELDADNGQVPSHFRYKVECSVQSKHCGKSHYLLIYPGGPVYRTRTNHAAEMRGETANSKAWIYDANDRSLVSMPGNLHKDAYEVSYGLAWPPTVNLVQPRPEWLAQVDAGIQRFQIAAGLRPSNTRWES